jgi:hypothetical protein
VRDRLEQGRRHYPYRVNSKGTVQDGRDRGLRPPADRAGPAVAPRWRCASRRPRARERPARPGRVRHAGYRPAAPEPATCALSSASRGYAVRRARRAYLYWRLAINPLPGIVPQVQPVRRLCRLVAVDAVLAGLRGPSHRLDSRIRAGWTVRPAFARGPTRGGG